MTGGETTRFVALQLCTTERQSPFRVNIQSPAIATVRQPSSATGIIAAMPESVLVAVAMMEERVVAMEK